MNLKVCKVKYQELLLVVGKPMLTLEHWWMG